MFENLLALGVFAVAKQFFVKEPVQLILPIGYCNAVYDKLTGFGFTPLNFPSELVRYNKIWSLGKDIGNGYELHVRAVKLGDNLFNLSSHVDFGPRHSVRHLVRGVLSDERESYDKGKRILRLFLR